MNKIMIIADIHGRLNELKQLLTKWNPLEEYLLFIGDYFNRGPEGWAVIEYVKKLKENYPKQVIVLKGNHEEIFLDVIEHPYMLESYLFGNTQAITTLNNFKEMHNISTINTEDIWHELITQKKDIISFIKEMPSFKLWSKYLFVHAGVDPYQENIEYMDESDMRNIRDEFIYTQHNIKKVIVFGHTPTQNILINEVEKGNIWISKCRKKIGIDGGFDRLNALVIHSENELLINYYVKKNEGIVKEKRYIRK